MKHTFTILFLTINALAQSGAEKLLGEAQHKEEVQGDLNGAIAAYRRVISQAGTNRSLAARGKSQAPEHKTY
ncbi:MAG: hypothetical protein HY820_24060 [Acidobacteria bacterium]|nr:hypothetical protein [Acidobacteriota bacterium]